MLRLLSIDDNRGGMEFRKTFCSVCTATEIPFFDELPKEENHSFLSLIYYKERYYLFSSTFNVLCWTYYLMCLSHPLSYQACHFKALGSHDLLHMYLGQPRALNAQPCCLLSLWHLISFIHTNQYVCWMNPQ
jgi:hypothetical protein